jgi:hypothetical protein
MILRNVCWVLRHYTALFARCRTLHTHDCQNLKSNRTWNIAFEHRELLLLSSSEYHMPALSLVWCMSECRVRYMVHDKMWTFYRATSDHSFITSLWKPNLTRRIHLTNMSAGCWFCSRAPTGRNIPPPAIHTHTCVFFIWFILVHHTSNSIKWLIVPSSVTNL